MIRLIFGVIVSITLTNIAFAQSYTVTGKVLDSNKKPLDFVEINFLKNDSVYYSGLTNNQGEFFFKNINGEFDLEMVNYNIPIFTKSIIVDRDLDLGIIKTESSINLNETIVTSKKKTIEREVDRIIYNVENTVNSSGATVLEVLSKTPLVKANEQSIGIIGKGAVRVMLNDKIVQLSGQELVNYLKTLPSEDVKKIEVITSPSAKYEAEGNSGLINIITKKKNNDLFSGNYSTSFTKNSKESFGNNLGLNFNKNKFQSSIRFRHSDRKAKVYENQNLLYANGDQLNNNANREDHSKNYGINADLSYKTSSRNTLGIIYDYANNKSQYVNVNKTSYYTVNVLDSLLTTNSTYNNPSEIHTINLYDDLLLDTIGTKLSFVANYFDNKPSTTLDFVTDNQQNTNLMKIINTSFIRHKVYSGQIDLFKPMKWATFETGIKYTRFDNNSDIKYYDFINNDYLLNPNQSNNFGVIEDNYAAYLSMNKKIDKWTFKAGLRYEYTDLETQDNFKIKYGKLFPNFNLMYKIDNNTYTINYNKRINRPRLSQLNPFRWYSNPFTYNVGNPYLQPSISHNIEFNYLYKGIFMASLFGSRQEDAFSALINITEGIKETKYDNVFKTNNIGVNLSFEKDLFKFWNLSINASTFYSESESKYSEIETLNGWSTSYTINNAFTLLKKNNWIASLDFNHILPGKESNIQSNSYYFLSLGSRISLMENKLTLTARVNDMLKGSKTRGKMYYQDFSQSYNNYYDNRFFTIGINYNFGLIKNSRRNVQFNEQYRAN